MSHAGEYNCDVCDKTFCIEQQHAIHKKMTQSGKKYKCDIGNKVILADFTITKTIR